MKQIFNEEQINKAAFIIESPLSKLSELYHSEVIQNSFYKRDFFGTGYMDFTVLEICLHKATA